MTAWLIEPGNRNKNQNASENKGFLLELSGQLRFLG